MNEEKAANEMMNAAVGETAAPETAAEKSAEKVIAPEAAAAQPAASEEKTPAAEKKTAAAPTYSSMKNIVPQPSAAALAMKAERERIDRRREAFSKAAGTMPVGVVLPVTLGLGMLFSWLVLRSGIGAGLTLTTLLFYGFYTAFFAKKGRRSVAGGILLGIPMLLMTLSFAFNSSVGFARFVMFMSLMAMFALHVTAASGSSSAKHILSREGVGDSIYTMLISPFVGMGPTLGTLFSKKDTNKGGKVAGSLGKVIVGLLISVPVALVLVVLLTMSDAVFTQFVDNIEYYLDNLNVDLNIGGTFLDLIIGVIFTLFVLPLVAWLRTDSKREREVSEPSRWLDPIIAATISYVTAVIFVAYVVIQMGYFFPASLSFVFSGKDFSHRLTLPDNMTWAEYARSGFFELSTVVILSVIAICFFMAFCKRNEKGAMPFYLKLVLAVIAACNLIMSASAVLRMALYTKWCGLTVKRIGVLILIALMAVSLICIVIKLLNKKFPMVRVVAAAAICAAVCFSCMNVDRVCANVNVARHIESGTTVDVAYLGKLSYAAAPAVERLMKESPDEDIRAAAKGIIAKYHWYGDGMGDLERIDECMPGAWTYDRLVASKIVDRNGGGDLTLEDLEKYSVYARWQVEKSDYERWNDDEYYTFEEFCQSPDCPENCSYSFYLGY